MAFALAIQSQVILGTGLPRFLPLLVILTITLQADLSGSSGERSFWRSSQFGALDECGFAFLHAAYHWRLFISNRRAILTMHCFVQLTVDEVRNIY